MSNSQSEQKQERVFAPGPRNRTVRSADGTVVEVPADWTLLLPGDAALTKRVKAAGDYWLVQKPVKRKLFSCGIWANGETISRIEQELYEERSTAAYAKRKETQTRYREKVQDNYVDEFFQAVCEYLKFHPNYADSERIMARLVTDHATPVGSGTVARTKRFSIEKRAAKAVIAWMRHATTNYDKLPRAELKGRRREVREDLAKQSRKLLQNYRMGNPISQDCPLMKALAQRQEL